MVLSSLILSDVPTLVVTLLIFAIIYGGIFFVLYKIVNKLWTYIVLGISLVLLVVTFLFNFFVAFIFICAISGIILLSIVLTYLNNFKSFISNPMKRTSLKSNKNNITKIFDRQEFYQVINNTVLQFSKSKTGALMTFEKNDDITSSTVNGVLVDAPVSQELLSTIFYPGTRLHDGAVIIKGNIIKYASVFYTPSTQAYTGKYGSRHRAAIGISEISDAITVVVSEETGRISIAVGGQIESVSSDDFLTVFENYMLTDEDKKLEIYN